MQIGDPLLALDFDGAVLRTVYYEAQRTAAAPPTHPVITPDWNVAHVFNR